jgi:hypothetical protein
LFACVFREGHADEESESDAELSSESEADDDDNDDDNSSGAHAAGPLQSSSLPPNVDGTKATQSSGAGGAGGGSAVADGAMMRYVTANGDAVCVFRAVLPRLADEDTAAADISRLHSTGRWAILLLHGGHFAGALLRNGEVTHHKCFHR